MVEESQAAALEFSAPYRYPYQIGLFLATNAIPDAYALIDGPDCVVRKAEWVFGNHDRGSTLMDVCGVHRVVSTLVNAERVIKEKGDDLIRRIYTISERAAAGLVLICSMPHVTIIGTQYEKIIRELQPRFPARLIEVPSRSLDGDWLDGYAESLNAIADHVDVEGAALDPRKVAVIGHLMDRTEQDQVANVAELRRMFAAIGLEVVTTWLDGGAYASLGRAREAATLVALPLGRKAARALAARTGATVVEAEVPFGLGRTLRMLRKVARAAGRADAAEAFIDAELARVVPRVEWLVRQTFLGKRVVFSGAPHLFGGMLQIASELGMRVALLASPASRRHLDEDLSGEVEEVPPMIFAPTHEALGRELLPLLHEGVDLVIGDTQICDASAAFAPVLELGFPAHFDHALSPRPHLGFEGWVAFVDAVAGALSRGTRTMKLLRNHERRTQRRSIPVSELEVLLSRLTAEEARAPAAKHLRGLIQRYAGETAERGGFSAEADEQREDRALSPASVVDDVAAE